jgi:hypothetical protein
MAQENPPDFQIEGGLKTLGVELLCQWDVLVFLYRHLTCLVSAKYIARLLGHPISEVVAALGCLDSLGLVERSRVDRGVRLFQFAAPGDPRSSDALDRLLTLAGSRAGRLLLSKKLRRSNPPKQDNGLLDLHREEGCAK